MKKITIVLLIVFSLCSFVPVFADDSTVISGTNDISAVMQTNPDHYTHMYAIPEDVRPEDITPGKPEYLKYFQMKDGTYNFGYDPALDTHLPKLSIEKSGKVPEDLAAKTVSLPASYDARTKGVVTPVRDQSYTSLCWMYSAIATAESSLLSKGEASKDDLDLSEAAAAYLRFHTVADPLNLIMNDKTFLPDGYYWMDFGGSGLTGTFILSRFSGPITEADAPLPKTYDEAKDFSLADSLAYGKNYALLKNSYIIDASATDVIKTYVMESGAVLTAMNMNYYDSAKKAYTDYYNEANASYYMPLGTTTETNHLVTIVGWDDNYSASNFKIAPEGNGAYLIKNSWGADWGNDGYFWLSYYDDWTQQSGKFVFDSDMKNAYTRNYQHDGGTTFYSYWGGLNSDPSYIQAANVFTAQKNESLKAVSFYTYDYSVDYEVSILTNVAAGDSLSGNMVLTQSGSEALAGYHTIDLDRSISIPSGTKFAVSVKLKNGATDTNALMLSDLCGDSRGCSLEIKPQESYWMNDNHQWEDVYNKKINGEYPFRAKGQNWRIKALTEIDNSVEDYDYNWFEFGTRFDWCDSLNCPPNMGKLPGTGFPTNHLSVLPSMPENLSYADLGFELELPSIDVKTKMVGIPHTDDNWPVEWLGNDAGVLEGSSKPGEGITYIAAHNHLNNLQAGPFLFISKLENNDRIFIHKADGSIINYKVVSNQLANPDNFVEISAEAKMYKNPLVLITCEDETADGGYLHRRIVFAEQSE